MNRLFSFFKKAPIAILPVQWLIVGLGNPGKKHRASRHNAGFQLVDFIAGRHEAFQFTKRDGGSLLACGNLADVGVALVKPQIFMNKSGEAVAPIAEFFQIPPDRIMVAYDDIDLPLASLRLRTTGSSGGHKGVRSIIQHLRTVDFQRIRLGIGRPVDNIPIETYVLQQFDPGEWASMVVTFEKAADVIESIITNGIEVAMNRYKIRMENR
jgi:PTH1 family peptidyl-tRNA hydrolase